MFIGIDPKRYSVEVVQENKQIPVGTKVSCWVPLFHPEAYYIATPGPYMGKYILVEWTNLLGVYDRNGRVE